MSITGEPKGDPMKVGVAVTDILTGMLDGNTETSDGEEPPTVVRVSNEKIKNIARYCQG
jgi:hypothetical protein